MAASIDFYPTLAALAGADLPSDRTIDGLDIAPLLHGKKDAATPHEAYFYYNVQGRLEAVRSGNWKLRVAQPKSAAAPATAPKHNAATAPASAQEVELYDLAKDVGEKANLAGANPAVVERLRGAMMQFAAKLNADLRPAGVAAPPIRAATRPAAT